MLISDCRSQGMGYYDIAGLLNWGGVQPTCGDHWYPDTVKRVAERPL